MNFLERRKSGVAKTIKPFSPSKTKEKQTYKKAKRVEKRPAKPQTRSRAADSNESPQQPDPGTPRVNLADAELFRLTGVKPGKQS